MSAQKKFKQLMNDKNINFYDVVKEAENYFKTHDKNKKGSGWKGYSRWKNANEHKYYPSGIRNNRDPFFAENAYKAFLKNNNISLSSFRTFDNGWEELGPSRIDNITGHYSAGIGRVEDHYVDPNNDQRIYLGSRSGGFWRTLNGGTTWEVTTDFLFATGVNTIAVSPTNPNHILINVRNASNGNSHGVYLSTDGGLNWLESNFNPTTVGFGGLGDNFKIYEIEFHPTIANLIFIGTSKGIYRSDDNLATWTRLINSGDIEEIEFHPTNPDIIYLYDSYYWGANKNVVMRSTNQGLSYTQSNIVPNNNDNRSVHLSVSNGCANCLYFASDNGVWKSTDDGLSFTFLNNPPEGCGGFAVNDLDNTKMIYGYVDIEASTDDGATFNNVTRWSLGNTNGAGNGHQQSFETSTNYVHADLHPAKCVNGVFYIGTDGLFCKSTDNGITWETLNQGTGIRENYKLGVSQSNHYRSISGSQDNGTSIKTENGWIEFYGADGMEGYIHPLNDDWMIASLQSGGRRRTTNGGQTQDGITPSGTGDTADWEAPIIYDPNNQMTVYDFRTNIFKSEDFGTTWANLGTPSFTGTIDEVAVAENNSNIIVVSSSANIEKSIDGGITFSSIRSNLPNATIQDIAFDPNDDDVIIVTYGNYNNDNSKIYISTNGGSTWANITSNLGNMPIRTVVIDHTDASNIYLGAEIGVYTKPMNGSTWSLYNQSLANTTIEELEIVYGSNTIKAATWGRGLWEYTLVGRNSFPSILKTKITNQPTLEAPKESIDQFVTSTIEYNGTLTNVYVEWSANYPTFGNVIQMSNTTGNTWKSDTAIPNQPEGTKVYFKVFATGSNSDTSETYKFMYTVRPYEFCESTGTMSYQGNITLVDFANINNATGKIQPYTDYFDTVSTEVSLGDAYNLTVNVNTDNGNYQYYGKVWIDWDQDLSFEDHEAYDLGFAQNVTNGSTSLCPFNITVPVNAPLGETRMRISCRYSGYPNACDLNYDGEVEDYKLIVNDNSLSIDENELTTNLIIESFNNAIEVKLSNNTKIKKIDIYSILGQTLFSKEDLSNSYSIPSVNLKDQFLILIAELDDGSVLVKKVFVK